MKVLKFGGTSVGTIANLRIVKDLLKSTAGEPNFVVCSAMSGITDALDAIAEAIRTQRGEVLAQKMFYIKERHIEAIDSLIEENQQKKELTTYVHEHLAQLFRLCSEPYSDYLKSRIITLGELLLTRILSAYLNNEGVDNTLLDAKDFMFVDSIENPNIDTVSKCLEAVLRDASPSNLYITQGFVCIDENGNINHLQRGGSDYSASIIGAALEAEEVQIWTDIDGFHNNDPRYVQNTRSVSNLSYDEASELAYFGAKILHSKTVLPLVNKEIPIILKNTMSPRDLGTVISKNTYKEGLKAISAKDNVTFLRIKSNRVLMPYSFLQKVFEVFNKYHTPVDMVTTSEISVSLIIEKTRKLLEIKRELDLYAKVLIEPNHSVICIVGKRIIEDKKSFKLFEILNHIPVKMISFGGSDNNISILINAKNKTNALCFLNERLFMDFQEAVI